MSAQAKVIALKPIGRDEHSAVPARRQELVARVEDLAVRFFAERFQDFNGNADDFLFELAGKTKDEDLHYLYLDTISRLRNKRAALVDAFNSAFTRLYRDNTNNDAARTAIDSAAIDRMLLAGDEDIESAIAIKNLVTKAHEQHASRIEVTAELITQIGISNANPLAPIVAGIAWKEATDAINLPLKSKYIVYKLFSKFVLSHLHKLYDQVIGELGNNGVFAQATPTKTPVENKQQRIDATASGEFSTNSFTREVVLKRIVEILKSGDNSSSVPGSEKHRQSIIEALSVMQNYAEVLQPHAARQIGANTASDMIGLFGRLLNTACGTNLHQDALDTIDLLRVMLDVTLEDKRIEARIRDLTTRLQLPLLKIAFLDKSFFDDNTHAGRRVVQTLIDLGLGTHVAEEYEREQLFSMAQRLVTQILNEFRDDIAVLDRIVDTSPLFQRDSAAINRKVAEQLNVAGFIETQIDKKIQGRPLPDSMRSFLHTVWVDVLAKIQDKTGTDSEAWTTALKAVDELVTVAQKHESPLHHAKVVELVPGLLCKLQSGLSQIAYDRQKKDQLFNELLKLHARSIQFRKSSAAGRRKSTAPGRI